MQSKALVCQNFFGSFLRVNSLGFITAFFLLAASLKVSAKESQMQPTLINGSVVTEGFEEVVSLRIGGALCTGTIVGERIVLTAAHCVQNGQKASFTYRGISYTGEGKRSDRYPRQDHDIAVILTANKIRSPKMATIGGDLKVGSPITLLGYGCTDIGGNNGVDGKLRKGLTSIIGFSGYDVVSRTPRGAALCFGDSGGPAFVEVGGARYLAAVNSKGNIRDTNYNTRLDLEISQKWLHNLASKEDTHICGITKLCNVAEEDEAKCRPVFYESLKKMEILRSCLKY